MSLPDMPVDFFPETRIPELKAALEKSGIQRRRMHFAKWACLTAGGVLLGLLLFCLVDYVMIVGWITRSILLLVLVAGAAAGVFKMLQKRRAYTNAVEVAREVEDADPRLGCLLSTAIEYGAWDASQFSKYEARLVDNLLRQAAEEQSSVWPDLRRALRRPVIIAASALVATLLFLLFVPQGATAYQRLMAPWSRAAYTSMEVTPGSADVPEGRTVQLDVRFGGRIPPEAQITFLEEGQGWKTLPLKKAGPSHYYHSFPNVRGRIVYQIVAPKVESPTFTLESFRPPEIKAWKLVLTYPPYTGLAPRTQNLPDVSAVRATKITFQVEMAEDVRSLALDLGGKETLALTNGVAAIGSADLEARTSTPFWLVITDRKGRVTRSPAPHQLVVLPDTAPTLDFTKPGKNSKARATDKVPLEIAGRDDFGLESLKIVYKNLGRDAKELSCSVKDETGGKFSSKAEFDVAALGFKVGDVIAYYAEAVDRNNLDGPGVGKSPVYILEITDEPRDPNAPPPPPPDGQSQEQKKKEIDLYELQKEILKATITAGEKASADTLRSIAEEQAKVNEMGEEFKQLLQENGVKEPHLLGLVDQARAAMTNATESLNKADWKSALAAEEVATKKLAELMAIIKPEVLQKINQQMRQEMVKKEVEQEKKQEQQIEQMLQQINQIAQEQTKLNEEKPEQKEDAKEHEQEQQKLAEKTQDLAEKAQEQQMKQAGKELQQAQAAMMQNHGEEGLQKLMDAATALRMLKDSGMPDASAETYPNEYEGIISAYFRKLSKEE